MSSSDEILGNARQLAAETGCTFEQAIEIIITDEIAWQNRTRASPDEPWRAILFPFSSLRSKGDE